MKKAAFILSLFYLLSAVGYGLEVHYCLGRVTDVNLAWLDTSCVCDESSASVAHKCCDEKEFFVQIEDAHQASSTLYVACHHFDSIATPLVEFECSVQALSNETKVQDGPDPPDRQAIFKRNCAFIFYG